MKTLTKQENIDSIKSEISRYTRLKEMDKDGLKFGNSLDRIIEDYKYKLRIVEGHK